jgi:ParB family transcriptional regulator, chromosome partitioning protein
MKISGLGKGLSALIPNEIKDDFKDEDNNKREVWSKSSVNTKSDKENEIEIPDEGLDLSYDEIKKREKSYDIPVKDETSERSVKVHDSSNDKKDNNQDNLTKKNEKPQGLTPKVDQRVMQIPIDQIKVNKNQPRKAFDDEKLESLAQSISRYGLLNPVTVKEVGKKEYEIIAGERRFRASMLAGLDSVSAIVKEVNRSAQLELALIENIQREDLNPVEEASAYKTLIKEFGLTQSEVAERVGKGRSSIANSLRFLNLPQEVREGLAEGKIVEGHAKLILGIENPNEQLELYRKVVDYNLTIKNLENIIKNLDEEEQERKKQDFKLSPIMTDRQQRISDYFGLKAKIKPKAGGGGRIVLDYYNDDDLERLMEKFN